MTNDQRLALCQEIRWEDDHGTYPFTYLDEKGQAHHYTIDGGTGAWVEERAQQIAELLDEQLLADTRATRDKVTKMLRDIR